MRYVRPEVFMIAKTIPQSREIADWLTHIGCSPEIVARFSSDGDKNPGERVIELAGRRCYLSFQAGMNPNVTRVRSDIAEYCENILKQKHGSVLEHVSFTFAIEGVSRVFTGEMNRHRAGVAISEGSMRYIRYNDIPIVEVPSLQSPNPEGVVFASDYLRQLPNAKTEEERLFLKKQATREVLKQVVEAIENGYQLLQNIWKEELAETSSFSGKKHLTSMLRRIIPMGVATGGIWTMNIRALRHICTMRCSEAAEEEIAVVGGKILERMMKEEPSLFGDFHPNEKGFWTPVYDKV